MPPGPGEGVEAGDLGDVGAAQLAAGEDDRVDTHHPARATRSRHELHLRATRVLVVTGSPDGRVQPEVRAEPEARDAGLGVGEDLGLTGVPAGPVGLGGKGVRVEMGGDVAAAPGVGVVAPGPADPFGLLDDGEAPEPGTHELHAHGETGEPGADDEHRRRRPVLRRASRTALASDL